MPSTTDTGLPGQAEEQEFWDADRGLLRAARTLGPMRPEEQTREWIDIAIEVLAFRLTYGVTNPVIAIGLPPGDGDNQHRRPSSYQDLDRRLAGPRECAATPGPAAASSVTWRTVNPDLVRVIAAF